VKYIIVQAPEGEVPLLFPRSFLHRYIAGLVRPMPVVSAGFVTVVDGNAHCYGMSAGLKLRSRPEHDTALVRAFLSEGSRSSGI
jgi:hypothetical protein